jgi:hypothetical protein
MDTLWSEVQPAIVARARMDEKMVSELFMGSLEDQSTMQ